MFSKHPGNFILLVGIRMRIGVKCGLNIFMFQTLADSRHGNPRFNQHTGVGMVDIMGADFLDSGKARVLYHISVKRALGNFEESVIRPVIVNLSCVFFDYIHEDRQCAAAAYS